MDNKRVQGYGEVWKMQEDIFKFTVLHFAEELE